MSRYTVVWVPSAERELGEIWLASSDRERVTLASNTIDARLREHTEAMSIEIAEGLRGLEIAPLRILFEVLSNDAMVRILKVKRV